MDGCLAMRSRIWFGTGLTLLILLTAAYWMHRRTTRYDELIALSASRYNLDFYLVKALIYEESWFRPDIRGSAGELGLMQVTRGAAADFTALGDNVNIAARLASKAGQGEVLISEATWNAARIETEGLEERELELKGKSELVSVRVLYAG